MNSLSLRQANLVRHVLRALFYVYFGLWNDFQVCSKALGLRMDPSIPTLRTLRARGQYRKKELLNLKRSRTRTRTWDWRWILITVVLRFAGSQLLRLGPHISWPLREDHLSRGILRRPQHEGHLGAAKNATEIDEKTTNLGPKRSKKHRKGPFRAAPLVTVCRSESSSASVGEALSQHLRGRFRPRVQLQLKEIRHLRGHLGCFTRHFQPPRCCNPHVQVRPEQVFQLFLTLREAGGSSPCRCRAARPGRQAHTSSKAGWYTL